MALTEKQARKQTKREKEFYAHLASYLVVNTMLIGLNLFTSPGYLWFVWCILGWGVGLVSHAVEVFGLPGLGRNWEKQRMRELTGQDSEEAISARLRTLLDEEMHDRNLPAATEKQTSDRLQRRIEHLEAIVTSRDWDLLEAGQAEPQLKLPDGDEVSDEERMARTAGRVR